MNGLQKLYSDLHPTYELVNRVLTFGLDWGRPLKHQPFSLR